MKSKINKSCSNCGKRIIHFTGGLNKMTPCLDHEKCGAWLLWVIEGDKNHIEKITLERIQNYDKNQTV